jgi:acyl carrier protein
MDRQQIRIELEKLLTIVDDQILNRVQVQEETVIREGLGLDSLQLTELLFEIEERLNVKIADEEAQKLRTVGDLVTLIESKLGSGEQKPSGRPGAVS